MLPNTVLTCSNGISGVEAPGVCYVQECGTCEGADCGSHGKDFGLGSTDCCTGRIKGSGVLCSLSGAAPCLIDDGNCGKDGFSLCRSASICTARLILVRRNGV